MRSCAIVSIASFSPCGAQHSEVKLQPLQQAARLGLGVGVDLVRRDDLVREQRSDEVAAGAAPRGEQRILAVVQRIVDIGGEPLAQRDEIAQYLRVGVGR